MGFGSFALEVGDDDFVIAALDELH